MPLRLGTVAVASAALCRNNVFKLRVCVCIVDAETAPPGTKYTSISMQRELADICALIGMDRDCWRGTEGHRALPFRLTFKVICAFLAATAGIKHQDREWIYI